MSMFFLNSVVDLWYCVQEREDQCFRQIEDTHIYMYFIFLSRKNTSVCGLCMVDHTAK